MPKIIDRVNWSQVPQVNSIQKKAMKKLIRYYGNSTELAKATKWHKQSIYRLLRKSAKRGQNLMHPHTAQFLEKISKIKGLAEELCPSLKKIK